MKKTTPSPRPRPRYELADLLAEMPAGLPLMEGWDNMPTVGLEAATSEDFDFTSDDEKAEELLLQDLTELDLSKFKKSDSFFLNRKKSD